jgi:hypothetical protein
MAGVPEVNVGFNSAGLCVGSEISACESGYSNNKIQSGWFLSQNGDSSRPMAVGYSIPGYTNISAPGDK